MACCRRSPNTYAFKTAFVLFLQTLYSLGTLKAIGVYVPGLIEGIGLTPTDIGLALGFFGAFSFVPGPFITYLYQSIDGWRRWALVMAGAVLAPGALIAGGFVNTEGQLIVCLSTAGLGANILSIATVITLRRQADESFGLLYGIGKSGYAFGMALVPLLADYLMELYGWRGSLMMIGALMSNLIPLTMLVDVNGKYEVRDRRGHEDEQRALTDQDDALKEKGVDDEAGTQSESGASTSYCNSDEPTRGEPDGAYDEETASDRTKLLADSSSQCRTKSEPREEKRTGPLSKCGEMYSLSCQWLRNSVFNRDRWLIHLMFVTFIYSMLNGSWNGFLIPRAVDRGFDTTVAISFAYAAAVGCFVGRFFGGFILGLKRFTSTDWFLFLTLVNILSVTADIMVDKFGLMIVTSLVSSMTLAERSTLMLVLCTDRVTEDEFPLILATSEIVFGLGTFIGASLAGFVTYVSNSFNASYVFVAGADVLVFFLMIPRTIVQRKEEAAARIQ